jgi:hypothetical protein
MGDLCRSIWCMVAGLFRSRAALRAEILVLRHQFIILRRRSPKRLVFSNIDRLVLVNLYRFSPKVLDALAILKPATVIAWHRAGFRTYWRWRSRRLGGRPTASCEIRNLIREISFSNPLWGAPRIHGELLKLGSMSAKTPLPSTWRGKDGRLTKVGRPSLAIIPMGSQRWTCSSCRRSHFDCSTGY